MTCDNASNNDTMVTKLKEINLDFNGQMARGRCFLHTMNLTAKALMCLFDPRQGGKGTEVEGADIHKLADGLLEEESVTRDTIAGDDDEIQDDNDDRLVDDVSALTEDERKNLLATIKPVKMALMKVDLIYLLD